MAATVATLGLVTGLTFYAFTTKSDFTLCGGVLMVFMFVFIIVGLFAIFLGKVVSMIYCGVGVMFYGFFLVYDTQMIIGQGAQRYQEDDYILAALNLYLDVLQIFMFLLQLLSACNSD
jgi:FtsH-binding integral membrane protein